ncbi:hypothetical protein PIB30_090766 [Stylosanthes scabra]|uniref:Aminotransferase-like plant mobile domain-containing protein n=1 Tax=Stylosanthes scabra TaxID=79078 RepID=A0ABU6UWU5_9FABA|nr:hypothetical protein [Stylosanthes scabra]
MFSLSLCVFPDGAKPGREYQGALSSFRLFPNPFRLAHNSGVPRVCFATKRDHLNLGLEKTFAHSFRLHPVIVHSTRVTTFKRVSPIFHLEHRRIESAMWRIDSAGNSGLVFVMFESTLQRFRIDSAQESIRQAHESTRITRFWDLATMSRRKTPAVKLKSVPRKDPPQLSQLPLRKWFPIKDVWEDYQNFYSKMLILPPRFLSEGLLPEDNYSEFWELIDFQGLRPLLFTRERYYPRMMAVVAATLQIHDDLYDDEGDGDFQLMFWLAGFGYTLSLDRLSSILGLENSGVLFKGGSDAPKMLRSFSSEIAAQRLRVSHIIGRKYSVSAMRTDHRLLQCMLSYIWLPRRGNHGVLTKEDLVILWAMVKKIKLNWPYHIAQHLVNCTNSCLIFEHLSVDLSGEEVAFADDKNAITTRHFNKMRRGPKAAAEKNVGAGEGSSHPQGVGSPTHFPPKFMESLTDQGMQSFSSSWSENVQGMDQRLDVYESRLSNRTKEIQELGNDMRRFFGRAAQPEDQGPQDGAPDQE